MEDLDYEKEYRGREWIIPWNFNTVFYGGDKHQPIPRVKKRAALCRGREIGEARKCTFQEIEFVNQLPKTQSGKIKRKQLREQEIEKKR
ncbi:MAG: hypothetical protein ACMUHM_06365 [Thermoplasmatota archaeon]